ncbi:MAG: hypothetical protein QF903_01940 [Planctomycetota bacterium]|nr:hypothetical protein [Planctomycetota bacterium]
MSLVSACAAAGHEGPESAPGEAVLTPIDWSAVPAAFADLRGVEFGSGGPAHGASPSAADRRVALELLGGRTAHTPPR